jgi:hypothetical protein
MKPTAMLQLTCQLDFSLVDPLVHAVRRRCSCSHTQAYKTSRCDSKTSSSDVQGQSNSPARCSWETTASRVVLSVNMCDERAGARIGIATAHQLQEWPRQVV